MSGSEGVVGVTFVLSIGTTGCTTTSHVGGTNAFTVADPVPVRASTTGVGLGVGVVQSSTGGFGIG